jgi:hypothetical protein
MYNSLFRIFRINVVYRNGKIAELIFIKWIRPSFVMLNFAMCVDIVIALEIIYILFQQIEVNR